jgi:hypothetical protein
MGLVLTVVFLDNGKKVPAFTFLGRIWPLLHQNVLKHPAKAHELMEIRKCVTHVL